MLSSAARWAARAAAPRLTAAALRTAAIPAACGALSIAPRSGVHALRRALSAAPGDTAPDIDVDAVAYGFMTSQALFTALELGVFDAIATSPTQSLSVEEIKAATGVAAPRMQTLLTALVAAHALRRSAGGGYSLSKNASRFLVSDSRHYYGDYLKLQIGRQFYHRMGALPDVMRTGEAPSYASWFSDPEVANTYTRAQHNGSVATAKALLKRMAGTVQLDSSRKMLDVGGGSGAFSYVFADKHPNLTSLILELPEVCVSGNSIRAEQSPDVQSRVSYTELDATSPAWPVSPCDYDLVLMSYISGSVPEPVVGALYANAFQALKPGGRLLVHDFMVDDSLDGPLGGAIWALQHVTVNADGLGLSPKEVKARMASAGFNSAKAESHEMIHGLTKLVVGYKD